jgi:hypothetical protein
MKRLMESAGFEVALDEYTTHVRHGTDMYQPFIALANACFSKLSGSDLGYCGDDPTIVVGSDANEKPDVLNALDELVPGVIERNRNRLASTSGSPARQRLDHPRFSIFLGLEAKNFEKESYDDPYLQCSRYALELFSNGGFSNCAIAVLVSRDSLELLYYDHSAVINSEPLRFTEDALTFLAILFTFRRLDPERWGYPQLELPAETAKRFFHCVLEWDGWELKLQGTLCQAHGSVGLRGSKRPSRHSPPLSRHRCWQDMELGGVSAKLLHKLDEGVYTARMIRIIIQEEKGIDSLGAEELAEAFRGIFQCTFTSQTRNITI